MMTPIYELVRKCKEILRLFSYGDAVRLLLTSSDLFRAHLRFSNRHIYFRRETTDLECLKQVFLNEDYTVPFPLSAGAIVDGGSNIGSATLYFKAKYPGHFIVSVEPDPSNFEILRRNCEGVEGVVAVQAAIWPVNTRLTFEDPNSEKWAFTVKENLDREGNVAAISIDEILSRYKIDRIALLKLDIEGAERELFSAASTQWLDRVDILAVELHDRFKAGCAQALYSALHGREFNQEVKGDTIFIRLSH